MSSVSLKEMLSPVLESVDNTYDFLLAVTSDSLYVLALVNGEQKIIETIIEGNDREGYVYAADDENEFLDAIIMIKAMILAGENPLNYLPKW